MEGDITYAFFEGAAMLVMGGGVAVIIAIVLYILQIDVGYNPLPYVLPAEVVLFVLASIIIGLYG